MQTAEQRLTTKLANQPNDAQAASDRGLVRLRLGKNDAAITDLRKAAELQPANAQLRTNLAYGLLLVHEQDTGMAEARKALELAPDYAPAHALLGRALAVNEADLNEAAAQMQRSLDVDPDQPDLRFDLVSALRRTKDYQAAGVQIRILRSVLPPSDPRLDYAEGLLAVDLGSLEAAIISFRGALKEDPHFVPAQQDLGAALVQIGRWKEAAEVLGPLSKAQPQSFSMAYMNALALQNSQRSPEAEAEVQRALTLDANSSDALTLLGIIQGAQGRHLEALKALTLATEVQPQSFDAQFSLGRERYAQNDAKGAVQAFAAAVKLRPQDAEATFFLGSVLEIAGEKDRAISEYNELVRLFPADPRGHIGLGSLYSKFGQSEQALSELRKALALDPHNFEANMALGRLLAKNGNFEESVGLLREAVRMAPENPEPHYQLALSLKRMGQEEEASREFAEVSRLNKLRRTNVGQEKIP